MSTPQAPTAVLTMGLPGAGKSTVIKRLYDMDRFTVLDPDAVKASHPDYDPKDPEPLHRWSTAVVESQMYGLVAEGRDFVWDGTGTNAEKMVQRIQLLHSYGYRVEVLYVRVATATAVARNAARERSLPERVIHEKAGLMATSFEIVSSYADDVRAVRND